ncbi:PREDICTED: 39S ribosomal protein L2, mitochondrial [Pygoscelis adeliae]|uniref:39S ribosomal protein L2, mitochondrial n=1 Tax=Pygoscelis adeliae TaxID=9238 RepID=UPI0004F4EDAF|nr:PREDICTED: 39S ribosomal protein L2, mitochondrial [Pygoscelis adeliae]
MRLLLLCPQKWPDTGQDRWESYRSGYASIGSLAGAFKETGALDLLMKMLCHKEKQIRRSAGKMLRALASHDAVAANEGDAYPLGALPVGTLICNLESHPGKGAQYIRAAGTCGVLLRKVNGTAIVQLPSKRHMQVLETCVATVGRVSNVNHNKRVIGKAGRNRWLGKRPHTGLWRK